MRADVLAGSPLCVSLHVCFQSSFTLHVSSLRAALALSTMKTHVNNRSAMYPRS